MGRGALILALAAGLQAQVTYPSFVRSTHRLAFELETRGLSLDQQVWTAAQIHCESAWVADAVSPAGAVGLSQFMPWTWGAYSKLTEPSCAGADPTDPRCAIRAQVLLMRENRARRHVFYPSDRMPAALADYNGGPTALNNERAQCNRDPGCNPNRWYEHVERKRARSPSAWRENREYPVRIDRARRLYGHPDGR